MTGAVNGKQYRPARQAKGCNAKVTPVTLTLSLISVPAYTIIAQSFDRLTIPQGPLMDWLKQNAGSALFIGSLVAIGVGFALERISLGLIVPGCIVCGSMIMSRIIAIFRVPVAPPASEGSQDA